MSSRSQAQSVRFGRTHKLSPAPIAGKAGKRDFWFHLEQAVDNQDSQKRVIMDWIVSCSQPLYVTMSEKGL